MDGSRIRKEKVADSKISRHVCTGPKNIHKNLCRKNKNIQPQPVKQYSYRKKRVNGEERKIMTY